MSSLKRILLMLALTCMWSPSFVFIKLAVDELPPLTVVALRVSISACILIAILMIKRMPLPTDKVLWMRMGVMALFSSVLPFCLFCYAETSIDSALAAILNGTTPMFTAVLAQLFVATDRMTPQKVFGVILSCIGVIVLFIPKLIEGVDGTTLGMSAALVAALCYSISHVYGKLYITGLKPFVGPSAQLVMSSIMMWPMAGLFDRFWTFEMPSLSAIIGVAGLSIFGTVFAFIIYYHLLEYSGPTAISTVACFFPVIGMFLGFSLFDETFSPTGLMAAAIILVGMLLVNEVFMPSSFQKWTVRWRQKRSDLTT